MKNKNLKLLLGVMVILLAVSFIFQISKRRKIATSSQQSLTDTPAVQNFIIYDETGQEIEFDSFLGKPIVMNFWTTWCPYCIEELDDFDKARGDYSSDVNFVFVDMNDGQRETVEKALEYLNGKGYENINTVFDTEGNAAKTFGVYSLPTTIYITAEGKLYDAKIGQSNYDEIVKTLNGMLK